jgi:hypothetical protein
VEFFGRLHLVKKVKCLPYTYKDLRGQMNHAALDPADTVVALALHNRHINALTGGSTLSVDLPELVYGTRSYTGQELWSVDEERQGLQEDWFSILRRFRPADAVTRAMTALLKQTALEKIQNYVGVHWRRGDRGHPEMHSVGDFKDSYSSASLRTCSSEVLKSLKDVRLLHGHASGCVRIMYLASVRCV